MVIEPSDDMPVIDTPGQLSEFVLQELTAFKTIYRAEAHHDLIGHMLTYSHALNLLHDLGFEPLFLRGVAPLQRLAKALRASRDISPNGSVKLVSPVDSLPLVPASPSRYMPVEAAYWDAILEKHDWDFGHAFKFPAAFYDHVHRAPQADQTAVDAIRYIIPSVPHA